MIAKSVSSVSKMYNEQRSLSAMEFRSQGRRELVNYQHHVNNLLAIVRAIAARTAQNSTDLRDFASHFDGRLAALARTQRLLGRTARFEVDLEELLREELLIHAACDGAQVVIEGPSVRLDQKAAENIGLALHELAVNAVKFGALDGGGRLSIRWRMDRDALVLEWRESDVPAVNTSPVRSGFGREWLEQGLPYQLGATTILSFQPGGLVCTIELPAAGHARQGDGP